ncbi:MAG: hypothetical protein Tsb0013_14550 [Phycisphaerales bacterium]
MNPQTTTTLSLSAALALSGSALAGVPSPMPQGTHTTSRVVQSAPGFSFDSGDRDDSDLFGPAQMGAARTYAGSTITVDSVAEYGALSTNIVFDGPVASTSTTAREVRGFSETGFRDDSLWLSAPGFASGELVTVQATFDLSYDLLMEFTEPRTGSGFAFQSFAYDFVLEIAGQSFAFAGQYRNFGDGATLTQGVDAPGLMTVDVQVPVGEAFSLGARLDSNYRAFAQNAQFAGSFSTLSDTEHFRFLGFSDLPQGAQLSSDFATYEPPVPTPASLALGGVALIGLAPRRRR